MTPTDPQPEQPTAEQPTAEQLDALLSAARWPEPDSGMLTRLEQVWLSAMAANVSDAAPAAEGTSNAPDFVRPVVSTPSAGRPRAVPGLPGWSEVLVVAAMILLAFLAGRWTGVGQAPDGGVPVTDAGGGSAETIHEDSADGQPDRIRDPESPVLPDPGSNAVAGSGDALPEQPAVAEPPDAGGALPMPTPEPDRSRSRVASRSAELQRQIESALVCIEHADEVNAECVQSLMKWRRESEYLLWQVVQNAAGQRRLAAITAIGFIGSDESVPGLLQTLSVDGLREASLDSLRRCADEDSLAAFVRQRQDPEVSEQFARELAGRPANRSFPVILKLVMNPECRSQCLSLADDLSPEAVQLAIATFDSPVVGERIAAAVLLGSRTDAATRSRLVGLIRQHPTRWEPVAALMWNGSEEAVAVLNRLQQSPDAFAVLQTAVVQLKSFAAAGENRW